MKIGWFPIGHLLTPTPYRAAFPRYCTSILKHTSDVLSISVAESVLCAMPCNKTVQHDPLTFITGIIGYLHHVDSELMKAFLFLSS